MTKAKSFTALDSLALSKILNVLRMCCEGLPTASFWARELGMTELERELIEIQDAVVAYREEMIEALKTCPATPHGPLPGSVKAVAPRKNDASEAA